MRKIKRLNASLAAILMAGSLLFPLLGNVSKVSAAAPGAPGIVTSFSVDYSSGEDALHVTWGAPDNPGDSPITHYDVEFSNYTSGADTWSDPISVDTPGTFLGTSDGLLKDHLYDIRVRAVNSDGEGDFDQINHVLYGIQVYDIKTCHDLENMSNDTEGNYTLHNNIDCSATADHSWNDGAGFAPIGGTSFLEGAFVGTLDGQGHTISGLQINRPAEDTVGLFGTIALDGSVSNLHITDAQISGGTFAGGVTGLLFEGGHLDNVSFDGQVIGSTDNSLDLGFPFAGVGGLAGFTVAGTITNSSSTGIVSADVTGDGVFNSGGGLIGLMMDASSLSNSYSHSQIFAGSNNVVAGGAIGAEFEFLSDAPPVVNNIYASGVLHMVDASTAGGLIGAVEGGEVHNSFSATQVEGSGDFISGGLFGQVGDGQVLDNNYYDVLRSDQTIGCISGDEISMDGCTGVNTEDAPDANYFFGNHSNEPMHSWDFNTVWHVNAGDYPTLDLREAPPTSGSGHHHKTLKQVKQLLTTAHLPITLTISPAKTVETKTISLDDFDDYTHGSGHQFSQLMVGQVIHFSIDVNGMVEYHTATVKEIGSDYIVLTIASTPFDLRIGLNETKTVSIDGQPVMQVNLDGIAGSSASLTMSKFSAVSPIAKTVATSAAKKPSYNAIWVVIGVLGLMTTALAINRNRRSIKK